MGNGQPLEVEDQYNVLAFEPFFLTSFGSMAMPVMNTPPISYSPGPVIARRSPLTALT